MRSSNSSRLVCLIILTFITLASATAVVAEKLPLEYFASLPDVNQVRLSPDGQHLASLVRIDNKEQSGTAVNVMHLDSNKQSFLLFAANEKYRISWIRWANNRKLFVSAVFPAVRQGTPTTETRLLTLDIKTKETDAAIPKRFFNKVDYIPQIQDRIIDFLDSDDSHFLVQLDGFYNTDPAVYKVSLEKNRIKKVQSPKRNVYRWVTDRQHVVRLGIERHETDYKIHHRFNEDDKWKVLWEFESFNPDQVWPLGFDHDPNKLYVSAVYEGRDAIFYVDLKDPALKKHLVYANDEIDVDGSLLYSKEKQKVIGIETNESNGYLLWDEEYKRLFKGLGKALKDTDNTFLGLSDDSQRYVILATSDTDSGTFFFGDRKKKTLSPVALRYSKLHPELMAEKNWIEYKARDGLAISAALTLPKSRKKDEKLPTIIFPHGGPISYTGSGFDYWTQFFANRGYAVLQMNFRGSSGYGYDFMASGLANWGLAMQDDVEDGTNWMIEQGYADPGKICIVGASYGGYAALMGAVKSPELYKCAVSFAGVMDVAYLVKSSRRYTNYEIVKKQVGSDYSELSKRSPVKNAEAIKIPVLLLHGSKDRVVRVQHSRRMTKALERKDKEVSYVELENGTHFLTNNDNRIKAFQEMEAFLAKYL